MSNKEIKQYITEKLNDKFYGAHQEYSIGDGKKADWCWLYPDGKAIIIEDKEQGDSSFKHAKLQLENYVEILKSKGYSDFIKIAVKDLKNDVKVEVYHNDEFLDNSLKSLVYYEQLLGTKSIDNISSDIYIYIENQSNVTWKICN